MHDERQRDLGTTAAPDPYVAERLLGSLWNTLRTEGEPGLQKMARRLLATEEMPSLLKALGLTPNGLPGIEGRHRSGYRMSDDPSIPPPYRVIRSARDLDRLLPDYQRLRTAMKAGGYEAFKGEWVKLMGPLPDEAAGGEREGGV
jgi:hypothetical protein